MAIDSIATPSDDIKITIAFFNAVGDFVSTVCKVLALIKRKFDLILIYSVFQVHKVATPNRAVCLPQLIVGKRHCRVLSFYQFTKINFQRFSNSQ